MTADGIKKQVISIGAQQLGMKWEALENNLDKTWRDLGADSLDEIELVMAAEEEIGQDFDDADWEKCKTPNLTVAFLVEKLS